MPQYYLTLRENVWWIEEIPTNPEGAIGPYHTKKEAKESMRGLNDFQRNHHRRRFFTCCREELCSPRQS